MQLITANLKPPMDITVVKDELELEKMCAWIKQTLTLGLDVETTPHKQFFARKCRLIQFGTKTKQYVIDLLAFAESGDNLRDCQGFYGKNLDKHPRVKWVIDRIRPFLESHTWEKVGVNLWFEYVTFYWGWGVRPYCFWDCQLAERVIYAGDHSLKDYDWYSMEEMMKRYFDYEIDKTFQTSFDVDNELTQEQYEYAALDTRFPHSIKGRQIITGENDKLLRTMELENEAIGAFAEMHVHGEKLNSEKWNSNTKNAEEHIKACLQKFDDVFLPLVGSKHEIITEQQVEVAKLAWKVYNEVSDDELALKAKAKETKKSDPATSAACILQMAHLEAERKRMKDELKEKASTLSKKRTKVKNLAEDCPGKALINYDSNAQMYRALMEYWPKQLKGLESTDEGDLKEYKSFPLIENLLDYRGWDKRLKTYGYAWTKEWMTHPGNEEGWVSPYTHRLHSMYNQLIAETGRTSSDNPNGQNLPREEEVRSCFIAAWMEMELEEVIDEDDPWVYVTVDMSGAELRIIADLANAKTWIDAFNRGEDIHSVSTEILMPVQWKEGTEEGCAYYALRPDGTPRHEKCKCKQHKKIRENTKTLNFLLMYGGSAETLAARTGMDIGEAKHLVAVHREKFPDVWDFLESCGQKAEDEREARDMFGRRRSFPKPTAERAYNKVVKDWAESLEYPEAEQKHAVAHFTEINGRKPNKEESFWLKHREPTQREISRAIWSMEGGIKRQGMNHPIQGTNASIAKVAAGSGIDKNGKPYLFHVLPTLGARFIKFVHDELVILVKKSKAQAVAEAVADAYKRAAAEVMTHVVMEADYKISTVWAK
jgi:DNA polymerase I-like protein with 3'-5' exonuclease and polymerase domains